MAKKFTLRTLATAAVLLACWAAAVLVMDPFFHYHMPLFGMEPVVYDERYQNAGIAERFPYDSVLLGSSMAENFQTEWFDEAFDCSTVKLTFSAGRTGAYGQMLEKAFDSRPVKNVFLGLDNASLIAEPGTYMFPLPEYLYDDDVLNDAQYLWNLDVLAPCLRQLWHNLRGTVPSLSDAYSWDEPGIYGREQVAKSVFWDLDGQSPEPVDTSDYLKNTRENLEKDIIPYIEAHPETQFYIFYPPYSVLQWDLMRYQGELDARLEATQLSLEMLYQYDNVSVYFFQISLDIIRNLDNYKDYSHYSAEINRQMVEWMKGGRDGKKYFDNIAEIYVDELRSILASTDCKALLEGE